MNAKIKAEAVVKTNVAVNMELEVPTEVSDAESAARSKVESLNLWRWTPPEHLLDRKTIEARKKVEEKLVQRFIKEG